MFSFDVKNSAVHLVFAVLVLAFASALEELSPKLFGVGIPFLLASNLYIAGQRPLFIALLFAAAAGGVEDALSQLPTMTCVSFFLIVAAGTHWVQMPRLASLGACLLLPVWVNLWTPASSGNVFFCILGMIPMGLLATGLVWPMLGLIERKAAINEQG